jgi:hypothetical protein
MKTNANGLVKKKKSTISLPGKINHGWLATAYRTMIYIMSTELCLPFRLFQFSPLHIEQ